MKLNELNNEELNIVADELDKIQFNIKVDINTDYITMSESEIKAMKALRTLLKKEAFSIREKAVEKRKQLDGENNEN
jgi:hypothetical protein